MAAKKKKKKATSAPAKDPTPRQQRAGLRRFTDASSARGPLPTDPAPVSGERVMMPAARGPRNKQAVMKPEETKIARAAKKERKAWEATPEGQRRTSSFDDRVESDGITTGQRYMINNYDVKPDIGPRVYDRQLPGMADPHAAPRPPKWEELTPAQRSHAEKGLRMQGTDMNTVIKDMGAQLDQAYERAWGHGTSVPHASDFYETGEPRKVVDSSARALGIPPQIHAMMNAFTSPNTKFSIQRRDGSTTYPNDEAARHAVRAAQQGIPADEVTNELSTTGSGEKRAQGYVTNIRKATSAMHQFLGGREPADWEFGPEGKGGFDGSPKTGPYANSWSDSHPQFTVPDIHTGGGGAFPHLGTDKVIAGSAVDEETGRKAQKKSDRELALTKTPFAHSAIDYAMRQAMSQRGLGSVRRAQASQWGEEQLQRGEAGLRGAPKERDVYRSESIRSTPSYSDGSEQLSLGFTQQERHDNHMARIKAIISRAPMEDF